MYGQVSVYSTAPDALVTELAQAQGPPPSEKATKACGVTHHFQVRTGGRQMQTQQ